MSQEKKATNVSWHSKKVNLEEIESRNGHKGCLIWLTGLSASGKSTIAVETEKRLFDMGYNVYLLDGDNMRHGLNKDLGFSPTDREENIRRIAEVSKLFRNAGIIVISAFISPYRKDRRIARNLLEPGFFIETHIKCSLEECIRRDPKGLYKKALDGQINDFTGISAPYEEPESPEIVLNTEQFTVEESVDTIIQELINSNIIHKD
jgi:adenylylsulfate kinase